MAGVVEEVGEGVDKIKVGDTVGVGVINDSCMDCQSCKENEE